MDGWTEAEMTVLRDKLGERAPLGSIARALDKPCAAVIRAATGVRVEHRRVRKVPRGAGYDKQSMKRQIVDLWRYNGTLLQYVRARGLKAEPFITAFKQHFPEAWADYVAQRGEPESRACPGCEVPFYPSRANQEFCTPKCASAHRRDVTYFDGNRNQTVGLSAGVCLLCGGQPRKGLSSHHVFGKERDPDGELLVALCSGCHDLVGTLARRLFADDAAGWEALITLVWLRRHGDSDPRVRVSIEAATRELAVA